jgi:tetratricopeptide (TPR) repeat protein
LDQPTVAVLAETRPPDPETSAQEASPPPSPPSSKLPAETGKPTPPEVAEQGTAKIDALVKQGNEALGRMDLSAAAAAFLQATTADPRRADAWYGLGKVRFEEGRAEEAAAHVEKALRLSPRRPPWRNFLGRVYAAMGNTERAIGEWQAVLKTNPGNAEAQRLLEKAKAL